MKDIKRKLKQALAGRQKRRITDDRRVPAAVLVPIFLKNNEVYILLTKRAETVKQHKGEISFPGGVCQAEDGSPTNTALRECAEEIGLTADDAEILGELDDTITTTTNYIITPLVALIPHPYHFQINEEETEEIIEVPVVALRDKNVVQEDTEFLDGKEFPSYTYNYRGRIIHGATARILHQFLDILAPLIYG